MSLVSLLREEEGRGLRFLSCFSFYSLGQQDIRVSCVQIVYTSAKLPWNLGGENKP